MSGRKFIKTTVGKVLLRTLPLLLGAAVFVAGSVSLAKYVYTSSLNDSAGTASIGIEVFELDQYGSTEQYIDYTQIVPGSDIPGPHIKLRLNSEVSYTLYVQVTETGDFPLPKDDKDPLYSSNRNAIKGDVRDKNGAVSKHEVISYSMSSRWKLIETVIGKMEDGTKCCTKTYKFNVEGSVGSNDKDSDYMFKPATKYNYTNVETENYTTLYELPVLEFDAIIVSQYYGDYVYGGYEDKNGKPEYVDGGYQQKQKFYISFNAYIKQVVNE